MYLKFSDIDRTGELSLYSIALLSKQQKLDTLYLRERAKEKIDAWENPGEIRREGPGRSLAGLSRRGA